LSAFGGNGTEGPELGDWLFELVLLALAFLPTSYLLTNVLLSRRRARAQRGASVRADEITIVVPVHHETPELFQECLSAAAGQECRLLVVGDGVDEPYRSLTEEAGAEFVRLPVQGGKKAAMAEGIRRVATPYVLFVDADTVLPSGAAEGLGAYFLPGVGGVGANLSVRDTGTGVASAAEFVERAREIVLRAMSAKGNVLYLDGACMMFRTDEVRPFLLSEEFQHLEVNGRPSSLGDDWLLTDHVIALGLSTVKAYDVRVTTSPKGSVAAFVRQNVRWSRSSWIRLGRYLRGDGPDHPGWFYRFELVGTYALPVLVPVLAILRGPIEFGILSHITRAHFWTAFASVDTRVHGVVHSHFSWALVVGRFQFFFGLAGTGAFLGAVARRIEPRRRLRTIAYGALGTGVLLATSIYGLVTFWVPSKPGSSSGPASRGPAPSPAGAGAGGSVSLHDRFT
jgi:cellulose synthase/poly-beta-1,6-N-acetylglucosamine synthase-like glycosyltransferase